MEWSAATVWWLLGGALVAIELLSGTFYLLMLGLGAAAGALAAHAGLGFTGQLVAAALVGGGATLGWHLARRRRPGTLPAEANPDVNLDIGQSVDVSRWEADGTAHVQYRGAAWRAAWAGPGVPQPGRHTIVAVRGNQLQVSAAS